MTRIIYNTALKVFIFLFNIFYWVNPKWKKRKLGLDNQVVGASAQKRLWFHCASAGEYEQIAEVIELLSLNFPANKVFVSFFSPSGMEWMASKNIKIEHGYLPFDGSQKMKHLVKQINPRCLIIAKNELWFNLISHVDSEDIPIFLVSASMPSNHFALRNKFFKKHFGYITAVFAQDITTSELLTPVTKTVITSGDTRISRIISKAKNRTKKTTLPFTSNRPIVIYGSLHSEDSGILIAIKKFPHFNHVIVPHNVTDKSITFFANLLGPSPTLSSSQEQTKDNFIIVNEMGKLADLYSQATYTYIGGGFGKGIHNVIEPLIHNNVVFIGPKYDSFHEAMELVKVNCIQVLNKPIDFIENLQNIVNLPQDSIVLKHQLAQQFISSHQHAASIVADKISSYLNEN